MNKKNVILIPVGCQEGHGVLPVDTDMLIARAFCKLVQRKADVQVGREVNDGFCATTCRISETRVNNFLSIFNKLKQTITEYYKEGFCYLILINIHGGNDIVIKAAVEDYFQDTDNAVLYFNPYTAFAGELDKKYFAGRDNSFKEISLYLAARRIMGMDPFSGPTEDEDAGRNPLLEKIRKAAVIGFSYKKPAQHIAWRSAAQADNGIKYLEEVAERFVLLTQDYKKYVDSGEQDA